VIGEIRPSLPSVAVDTPEMLRAIWGSVTEERMPRILVIDNDENVGSSLSGILTAQGYEVYVADDGSTGIEQCLTGAYDLVITDFIMAEIDGIEVMHRLRKAECDTPIIAMTDADKTTGRYFCNAAERLGAAACFYDSYHPEQLMAAIRKVFDTATERQGSVGAALSCSLAATPA